MLFLDYPPVVPLSLLQCCSQKSPLPGAALRAPGQPSWALQSPSPWGCSFLPLPGQSLPFPSLPFPSLPFPSLPFPSLPFPSLPFPSLPFPSLPFPSLPFPSLPFPSLPSLPSIIELCNRARDPLPGGLNAPEGPGVCRERNIPEGSGVCRERSPQRGLGSAGRGAPRGVWGLQGEEPPEGSWGLQGEEHPRGAWGLQGEEPPEGPGVCRERNIPEGSGVCRERSPQRGPGSAGRGTSQRGLGSAGRGAPRGAWGLQAPPFLALPPSWHSPVPVLDATRRVAEGRSSSASSARGTPGLEGSLSHLAGQSHVRSTGSTPAQVAGAACSSSPP
uniref:Uncharacterized protein n=1 Tax=Geospiza parvula TaxID=87175 RepID=A0A8U8CAL1_GEOPR